MVKAWKYRIKKVSNLPTIGFQGMKVKFLINKSEMDQMAAYKIHLPRKSRIPPSYHKIAREIIIVQAGRGRVFLNRKNIPVEKGDVILVQPRTWHSFSTGPQSLKMLAVTSPYVDSKIDLYHK